ncbi:MAG: NAD-dependent protein deacetylase of SIR2 family [Candidatus Lokiarchaeota archaeon]|nr:NAD-dependent protein deacetylase of SIR2 family [Candidatus Lokiarchaeota archaeon]
MIIEDKIQNVINLLRDADCVLIGAGAGLSVDAGNDYMNKKSFAQNYPELVKLGFQMKAQLMGYEVLPPDLEWSYLARHINEARFQPPPQQVYERLFSIVKDKDYFVVTSNVDMLFVRNGFDENKIFTPQGDYALLQCLGPCWTKTWETKPIIEEISSRIDPKTKKIDPRIIPKCPNCGGPVFMNVRGGSWFIEEPYKEQAKRFNKWIQKANNCQLLVIEIGAGFNTPGVVRWPMEQIVFKFENSHLIRVNLQYTQVPKEITEKSFVFKTRAKYFINALWEEMKIYHMENGV